MQKKIHNLVLLVAVICSINCFSQNPNPQLFQTWYLNSVQTNDFAPMYSTLAISPAITPTLTISSDLSITGMGSCNAFTGTFSNTTTDNFWTLSSFAEPSADCGIVSHTNFEANYFGFMQSPLGQYQIMPAGSNGLYLIMTTPLFGIAQFQNFPLSTTDFNLQQIAVYPNPVSSVFHLSANQANISKIQVINSLGQNVKTIDNNFETVDISELSSGMYILKIENESGSVNKKIIKG